MPLVGVEMNRRRSTTVEEGLDCNLNAHVHDTRSLQKFSHENKPVAGLGRVRNFCEYTASFVGYRGTTKTHPELHTFIKMQDE